MKKTLDKFFEILGYLWSFVYTIHLKDKFIWIHYLLYFGWIKRHFKHLGSVYFKMPTYINNPQCVEIDDGTCIGKRVIISATIKNGLKTFTPSVIIGKNCNIGDDSNIQCCNRIQLGNGVLLGRKVMINDTSHGSFERSQLDIQPNLRPLESKGPIVIDDNVWIGEMVCILGNVHIGQGAVIGAGAVVTKDIPPYSLAVGAPAKVIKSFDK